MTNEEYWTLLSGDKRELKYPKPLIPGHEYHVQIHVAEAYKHEGIKIKHKICQPVLSDSFRAGETSYNCK